MNYWWVNQGDTYEQARALGILWAPLTDKRGLNQWHWESMDDAREGDFVFHYSNNEVRGISQIISASRKAEISIRSRGQWNEMGREIRVDIQEFEPTIAISSIPIGVRLNTQPKSSPFDAKGMVKQGYFFPLAPSIAAEVLSLVGIAIESDSQAANTVKQAVEQDLALLFRGSTDGTISGKYRREQNALRKSLFRNLKFESCGICGREFPIKLLHAAHIKPRNECSHEERLDRNVVIPACLFGCDALFERGLITVNAHGFIETNPLFEDSKTVNNYLEQIKGNLAPSHSKSNSKYFEWHANNARLNGE